MQCDSGRPARLSARARVCWRLTPLTAGLPSQAAGRTFPVLRAAGVVQIQQTVDLRHVPTQTARQFAIFTLRDGLEDIGKSRRNHRQVALRGNNARAQ